MGADLVAGNSGSKLRVFCKDEDTGAVIALTSASVKLRFSISGGTEQLVTMTITDAVAGIAEYLFAAGELVPGVMAGQVEITDSASKVLTQLEKFALRIRK